ncbi:MAG: DUF2500 domain-containing protein [Ruminococcaceae bacterium]|nr:DUF2500 domain-containing protein [Oscillospiraceae bacterium]
MVSAVFYAAAAIVAIAQIAFEIHARILAKKNKGLEFNEVRVMDKRIAVIEGDVHYYITFRRKDGAEREFEVDSVRYSEIEEGEDGELCLEDETFKEK